MAWTPRSINLGWSFPSLALKDSRPKRQLLLYPVISLVDKDIILLKRILTLQSKRIAPQGYTYSQSNRREFMVRPIKSDFFSFSSNVAGKWCEIHSTRGCKKMLSIIKEKTFGGRTDWLFLINSRHIQWQWPACWIRPLVSSKSFDFGMIFIRALFSSRNSNK